MPRPFEPRNELGQAEVDRKKEDSGLEEMKDKSTPTCGGPNETSEHQGKGTRGRADCGYLQRLHTR